MRESQDEGEKILTKLNRRGTKKGIRPGVGRRSSEQGGDWAKRKRNSKSQKERHDPNKGNSGIRGWGSVL